MSTQIYYLVLELFLFVNGLVHNLLFELCNGIIFIKNVLQLWCKMRAHFVFLVFFSKGRFSFLLLKRDHGY